MYVHSHTNRQINTNKPWCNRLVVNACCWKTEIYNKICDLRNVNSITVHYGGGHGTLSRAVVLKLDITRSRNVKAVGIRLEWFQHVPLNYLGYLRLPPYLGVHPHIVLDPLDLQTGRSRKCYNNVLHVIQYTQYNGVLIIQNRKTRN